MRIILRMLVVLVLLFGMLTTASAQTSGETEIGTANYPGENFASQYVFYDWKEANLLTRYFVVKGSVNRGEFAIGPTLKVGGATVKLQFGGTTDREVKTAILAVGRLANRQVLYIGDANWSIGYTDHGTFYQKLFVALDEKSVWQFRIESLHFGQEHVFLRVGGEYQLQIDAKHHAYVAPFYDPITRHPGVQVGFRFF